MFTPASLQVLHQLGWVVERGWRWLRAIPPLAGRVSGLCDVEHGTGRRGPLEQLARMGAGVTPWPDTSGHVLHFLACSDAHSSAPCGRCRGTVVGQSLRPLRRAVRPWRGRRAWRGFALFSPRARAALNSTAPRSAPARPSY